MLVGPALPPSPKKEAEEMTDSMIATQPSDGVAEIPKAASQDQRGSAQGLLIDALAALPDKAILDETRLATVFGVTCRTVRRMVSRYELPPPVQLAGRSCWIVERILRHIEAAAERAEREAEREARRFRSMAP